MTYRVDTLQSMLDSAEGDDDAAHDAVRLENALNQAEKAGWALVSVVPQYRTWDDDNEFSGFMPGMFILHKPDEKQARLIN